MKLLPFKGKDADKHNAIDASMQLPGSEVNEDFVGPLRFGLLVLILGFGGAMLWGALAPLGQGSAAVGVVEVANYRQVIQHLTGGTVEAINVHDGDKVHAGQVLVRLNPVRARSNRNSVSAEYIVARTIEDRLLAEVTGEDKISFDKDLQQRYGDDPRYKRAVETQKKLFAARREARESEVSLIHENLDGAKSQLSGLKKMLHSRRQQIDHIKKQLKGVRKLAKQGYLPRNQMLELERKAAALQAQLYSDTVNVGDTDNRIKQLKLKLLQHKREFRKKAQAQLSDVQGNTSKLAAQLDALDYAVSQTEIRAPIDGIVQNMQIHTIGGTVAPGTKLMAVIPEHKQYVVRAKLPIRDIDRVHDGMPVDITFPSFNDAWTPSIPGTVKTVSASRIEDERSGRPFYRVEVNITDDGMQTLHDTHAQLRPGMPATVMIKLGERSLLSYLFKPLLDRLHLSLTE